MAHSSRVIGACAILIVAGLLAVPARSAPRSEETLSLTAAQQELAPQARGDALAPQGRGQRGARGQQGQRGARGRGGGRGGGGRNTPGVYRSFVQPSWFDDGNKFWYRNDLRDSTKEFVLVDAVAGTRGMAFDHARLARGLASASGDEVEADRLLFDAIEYTDDMASVRFTVGETTYSCNLVDYRVTEAEGASAVVANAFAPYANSMDLEPDVAMTLALESADQSSYAAGEALLAPPSPFAPETVAAPQQRGQRGGRGGRGGGQQATADAPLESPDGDWEAYVDDHDVYVRNASGTVTRLTDDGVEDDLYRGLEWAPDSSALIAFRRSPSEPNPVWMVDSMPDDGGPAQLRERNYTQPGNKMNEDELNVFPMASLQQVKPEIDGQNRWDFRPSANPRWSEGGHTFTVEKNDRGHQRYRVLEVDAQTGDVRVIIDEDVRDQSSFVWTDHTQNIGIRKVEYLDDTDEIVFDSEAIDGWRHLHLIDAGTGAIKNTITQGDYVVRGVQNLDVENRVLWFSACGVYPDQDPYFIHYGRVNFDGTGLTWLTEGDGTHSISDSPDGRFFIDNYSRVDMPPITELRGKSDGGLITVLETADYSEAVENGTWNPPVVFTAKGRDGETDIWGFIAFPKDMEQDAKYPIVEAIYAGPHSSHTPKNWGGERYSNDTENGFITVKLDGMGTANRSKAFHDVCWKNLHDAGFPDRIAWMKAAAEVYPQMDIERVGIYGGSAGGQNAMAALLWFGDFYDVAIANSGCHDNRIDKESWNEQWMGYRPDVWSTDEDNWYAANSNVDNAWRLRGRLQLVVGELDTNVPPESTMRVVDQLVQSRKDFELMVIPGANHGAGSPITARMRDDFLKKYLLGIEPPNRNAETADAPVNGPGGRRGR